MSVCIESATVDLKIVKQRRAGRIKRPRTETEDHDRPQNEQRAEVRSTAQVCIYISLFIKPQNNAVYMHSDSISSLVLAFRIA